MHLEAKRGPVGVTAGRPFIPLARPWMDEREADAVRRVICSGWVTQGPEVAAFEQEFAAFVGAAHACAVSSCTAALHVALRAVGVGAGDEVITASHSFIATANSIRYCGATPVFVDIDPGTFNLDPRLIEPAITARTKAILCVHQLGMPCDLRTIVEIARTHRIPVVEDGACAVGSEIRWNDRWERIGKPHGDVACFSFHPRKLLSTGDGGMITTGDADLDRQFRLLRQQGMDLSDAVRHSATETMIEHYSIVGYNYRLTDIQAAVGREQLKRLPELTACRRQLVDRYCDLLAAVPGIGLPHESAWARSNWQSFCVRLPDGCDQQRVMQQMLDAGIATRRGVMCAHLEPAYREEPWSCVGNLAFSEEAQARGLQLPLYHLMTNEEQKRVVAALHAACTR